MTSSVFDNSVARKPSQNIFFAYKGSFSIDDVIKENNLKISTNIYDTIKENDMVILINMRYALIFFILMTSQFITSSNKADHPLIVCQV